MLQRASAIWTVRASFAAVACAFLMIPTAFGQPAEEPVVAAPPPTYWLRTTGDQVNVRSRPDLNSRVVIRVPRDTPLQAVSSEMGWHKIVPPPGSFSYVSALYIRPEGEDVGVVDVQTGTLRVRVGSAVVDVDPDLCEVQKLLNPGERVKIIGRQGDWYRIVPPDDVYVYVSSDFTEQITAEEAERLRAGQPVASAAPTSAQSTTQPVTSQPTIAVADGRWARALHEIETSGETDKAALAQRLRPIADQRDEPLVAGRAARLLRSLGEDTAVATTQPTEATQVAAEETPATTEEEEQPAHEPPPPIQVRGVLRPTFALPAGPNGLRYQLVHPYTNKLAAYLEFPRDLGVDAKKHVGRYVGVSGTRFTESTTGATVIRVEYVTVLTNTNPPPRPAREGGGD